jgi:hypothetical protein
MLVGCGEIVDLVGWILEQWLHRAWNHGGRLGLEHLYFRNIVKKCSVVRR